MYKIYLRLVYLIRRTISKLFVVLFDKPLLLPTNREQALIEELKADFCELSGLESLKNQPIIEEAWLSYVSRLRELVMKHDPREFLRWKVISKTMFVGNAEYIRKELRFLKSLQDWKNRWSNAIKESHIGHPPPFWLYPRSSGNLIHNAYHLAQFEKKTKMHISNINCVFEFGGGYGSMCRLFHNLNFHGKYVIFDLPHFCALQRFFLRSIGLTVPSVDTFKKTKNGVVCISNSEQLKTIIPNHIELGNSMFIATWSMSETPVFLREDILSIIAKFDAFIIGYQERFGEVNNKDFFNNWMNNQNNIKWYNWEIEHLPNNFYLMGKRISV